MLVKMSGARRARERERERERLLCPDTLLRNIGHFLSPALNTESSPMSIHLFMQTFYK